MTDLTKIPVTVITGFLGAGKTTLIRHLMQNPQGKRLAILVNEFGTVGVDGDILKSCADDELPGGEHRGTCQRLHLLHRGRRFHPDDRGADGDARRAPITS